MCFEYMAAREEQPDSYRVATAYRAAIAAVVADIAADIAVAILLSNRVDMLLLFHRA